MITGIYAAALLIIFVFIQIVIKHNGGNVKSALFYTFLVAVWNDPRFVKLTRRNKSGASLLSALFIFASLNLLVDAFISFSAFKIGAWFNVETSIAEVMVMTAIYIVYIIDLAINYLKAITKPTVI